MFENATNSKKKGDIGVGSAIAYFTKKGYTVAIPLTDSQDYDLVVDIDGLKRIQVKTTAYKNKYKSFCINLSVKGGNRSFNTIKKFDWTKVDFLYIITADSDEYLIPTYENMPKGNMALSKDKDKYKL